MPVTVKILRRSRLISSGLFLFIYFLAMVVGLALTRFDRGVAVVWFAGALLFAHLGVLPHRRWLGVMLGAVPCAAIAIGWLGMGPAVALPLAVIGVFEAWLAAYLIKRTYPRFGRLQSIDEVARFLVVVGVLAPAIGALVAAWFVHRATGLSFAVAWGEWFAAHALGYIVFAPPLLLALRGETGKWWQSASPRLKREAGLLLAGVTIASIITFGQNFFPLVIFPLIAMVVTTLRLGRFGAMVSVVILMAVGLAGTMAGYGFTTMLHVSTWLKFEALQGYFAFVVAIILPLAAELAVRQRLLERVHMAEALHKLIVERSSDAIIRANFDGTISYASPSVARLWGYLPEEIVGKSIFSLVHPRDGPAVRVSRQMIVSSKDAAAAMEYRTVCKGGDVLWVEGSTRAVFDHQGHVRGTLTIIRDITERHELVDDPARQSLADPLTGLGNRRVFDLELARGLAAGKSGCLALFDLDHFKSINARYGVAMGDHLIRLFAEIMRQSVRTTDIAIRLGGEEFAVLLFGATLVDARQICQRIIARYAANEEHLESGMAENHTVVVATVSAGLARFEPGTSPEGVMTAADTALYHAKNAGRNRLSVAA